MSPKPVLLSLLLLFVLPVDGLAQYEPAGCLSAEEIELADLINQYRGDNGLPAIPVSATLTAVAQWHVADVTYAVQVTGDYGNDPSCNLHSWYGLPAAPYTTCCYTPDHAQANCMWSKPSEVSSGSYAATGYEIAAWGYSSPAAALQGWQNSSSHDDVILNAGIWSSRTWGAFGVGIGDGFYYVWFAEASDPTAAPVACGATSAPASRGALAAVDVHPNPFNPRTTISFELGTAATVEAIVFDARGREVRRFAPRSFGSGAHEFLWTGEDDQGVTVPSGVYFLRLAAEGAVVTRKLALIR